MVWSWSWKLWVPDLQSHSRTVGSCIPASPFGYYFGWDVPSPGSASGDTQQEILPRYFVPAIKTGNSLSISKTWWILQDFGFKQIPSQFFSCPQGLS